MKVYVNTAELDIKGINDFIERHDLEKWITGNNRIMVIIDDLPTFESFTKIAGTSIYCIDNSHDAHLKKRKGYMPTTYR